MLIIFFTFEIITKNLTFKLILSTSLRFISNIQFYNQKKIENHWPRPEREFHNQHRRIDILFICEIINRPDWFEYYRNAQNIPLSSIVHLCSTNQIYDTSGRKFEWNPRTCACAQKEKWHTYVLYTKKANKRISMIFVFDRVFFIAWRYTSFKLFLLF